MKISSSAPLFSVIIPTWNRVETLKKMLGAWERQVPTDLEFEIVVVDDGSGDGTSALLEAARPERYQLVRLRQENRGPAMARNRGLAAATGQKVLFTGDDIEPSPNLLQKHLEAHSATSGFRWAVLGNISWPTDLEITSTMKHVDGIGAQQFGFFHMTDGEEYDFRHFYTSNVSVGRAMLFREPSGFSTDFRLAAFEDAEFAYRLRRHGMRIVYEGSAVAWHHHPYTADRFFERQVACGRMAAVLVGKWPEVGRLIGLPGYRSSRRKSRFLVGGRRRQVTSIEPRLPEFERFATDIASNFDLPPTSDVDTLLLRLFEYGYIKGLAESLETPARALRLTSMHFRDLVVDAVIGLRREVDPKRLRPVEGLVDTLSGLSM